MVKWNKEVMDEVKLYQANDYDIKEETPTYVLMQRNNATLGMHVLVFILTFWFTLGIGNIVYHLLAKKTKKVMK
jgi:hypothetical protein